MYFHVLCEETKKNWHNQQTFRIINIGTINVNLFQINLKKKQLKTPFFIRLFFFYFEIT